MVSVPIFTVAGSQDSSTLSVDCEPDNTTQNLGTVNEMRTTRGTSNIELGTAAIIIISNLT
jgi:hypothetical protein